MTPSYTPRQAALWFAREGHPVLPLHSVEDGRCTCGDPACTSAGKHPHAGYAPHGAKDATTDIDTIRTWFAESYWLNYGVACTRLFVVDVDVRHDGLETWRAMHAQPTRALPHTWQVLTGSGGLHVFFTPPAKVRNGDLDKGIQLKATGGYVVGAGCKHKSGGTYNWLPQCSPKDAPLGVVPTWLLTMMETRCYLGTVTPPTEWRRLAGAALHDGERHTGLLRIAGHLLSNLLNDPVEILELLLGWNRGRCVPPLSDADVIGIVERLCERERNKQREKQNWLAPA